jgi:hypothetical protein
MTQPTRWTDLNWQVLLILNRLRNQQQISDYNSDDESSRDERDTERETQRRKFTIVRR